MLSSTDKNNRTLCSSHSEFLDISINLFGIPENVLKIIKLRAEGSSSLGVTIQLGDDDRTDVNFLFEGPSLSFASLTDRGVHHEDNVVRFLNV